MSRCLGLARLALGANSRLICARGQSSRAVSCFLAGDLKAGQQQRWSSQPRLWSSQRSGPGFRQQVSYSTQEAEKAPEDDPIHTIITDRESVQGSASKHEFQADTRKLLDIVAKSLYSEREVFIRELISNSSDSLEKLRHHSLTAWGMRSQLEIHLQTDASKRTFTIQDTGMGMSKEELVSNLGTIAHSGSKAFLEALDNQGKVSSTIIGQFGVGFYSSFVVAKQVEVYSRSAEPGAPGYRWSSDGSGVYEIAEATGVQPGTKIVLHLKDECEDFSFEDKVKEVVTKYSNFVGFPIYLNGRRLNSMQALWVMDPKEIDDWKYGEFYRFIGKTSGEPRYTFHYRADAPLNIQGIFYVPHEKPNMFEVNADTSSKVSLYSRKVLIQSKSSHILPRWLRFLHGVVDSEDIPLNLSRELLQESPLLMKIRDVLEARLIRFLLHQSKKDPEKYCNFLDDYRLYISEGIITTENQHSKENIAKLLQYESSALPAGQQTSLTDYISRMKPDCRNIYYLFAPSREIAEQSPYFEAMKQKNHEVLFCYKDYDEVTVLRLGEFDKKRLMSVEADIVVDHYKEEKFEDTIPESERLTQEQANELMTWMKESLGPRVANVKLTPRLNTHPAMITQMELGATRRVLRTHQLSEAPVGRDLLTHATLEINAGHFLIKKLYELKDTNSEMAALLFAQIYDNAMIAAGLLDDARPIVSRLNELLSKALEKY
ncbi:heat shock protein 75 kDa, mitochondrial [Betta splendens]|uniref:Heat shock protein 75 kDa, mitochondrial n=1 Tax=Betta splendens TaxID=158456 RepID=A0A6P7NCP0_BETSP|nr:heat shock protein 75 kDa, mitochondrial [Betta splendens]